MPKILLQNRRSISNSSLKAGKEVWLVWPQPQVPAVLGQRRDWWEGWLVGTLDMSVRALQTCLPSPPALALLHHRHPGPLSQSSRPSRAATGSPASLSSSRHESTRPAPTSPVPTTPGSGCQPAASFILEARANPLRPHAPRFTASQPLPACDSRVAAR